jgi:hypothetical protein
VAIDPELSTMMTSAALVSGTRSAAEPAHVTVTIAWTSRAPGGKYSFWNTSTPN